MDTPNPLSNQYCFRIRTFFEYIYPKWGGTINCQVFLPSSTVDKVDVYEKKKKKPAVLSYSWMVDTQKIINHRITEC